LYWRNPTNPIFRPDPRLFFLNKNKNQPTDPKIGKTFKCFLGVFSRKYEGAPLKTKFQSTRKLQIDIMAAASIGYSVCGWESMSKNPFPSNKKG
jgi:hypothetical protein